MLTDKPFANLRNLIHGDDERKPRHGTLQPASPQNRDDARQAINEIHLVAIPIYNRECSHEHVAETND